MTQDLASFSLFDLINCKYHRHDSYFVMEATPATGILYITDNSPYFISGHIRLRGKDEGRYPYKYLEMIDSLFGPDDNTIEVCSRSVSKDSCFTVDINPDTNPVLVDDAQYLTKVANNSFSSWRADPPYNQVTAMEMYGTELPITGELLKSAARVCKPTSLLFLLLGPQNYQWCPKGIRRIGWIAATIVPNQELRALHIFFKYAEP